MVIASKTRLRGGSLERTLSAALSEAGARGAQQEPTPGDGQSSGRLESLKRLFRPSVFWARTSRHHVVRILLQQKA